MKYYWVCLIIAVFLIILISLTLLISLVIETQAKKSLHTPNSLDSRLNFIYQPDYQQNLLCLFNEFVKLANKYSLSYWLCGGSLLGQQRHGGFIPHDDDIDIAMPEEELNILLDNLPDYLTLTPSKTLHGSCIMKLRLPGLKQFVDIFPVAKTFQDGIEAYRFIGQCNNTFRKQWWMDDELFPLRKRKFHDIYVLTPNNPLPYLERVFGENWNTSLYVTHYHHKFEASSYILSLFNLSIYNNQHISLDQDTLKTIEDLNSNISIQNCALSEQLG